MQHYGGAGLLRLFLRPWLSTTLHTGLLATRLSRALSTVPVAAQTDSVQVPVGSSGSIKLDIHHPPRPSPTSPIIIYLPRGPFAQATCPEHPSLAPISLAANATVVRLNYRCSAQHPYPYPIHDLLAGYDWIKKHLPPPSSSSSGGPNTDATSNLQLGVCGELLGGSLAAALALTECYPHRKGSIGAAFLGNPITDWTAMHAVPQQSTPSISAPPPPGKHQSTRKAKSKAKTPSWLQHAYPPTGLGAKTLLLARCTFFPSPSAYYDAFASPLTFFRTPASDIPPAPSSASFLLDELFAPAPETLQKKRRAHRRHPPADSGLVLPRMRISVGRENILRDQGVEFAEMCRRAAGRDGNGDGGGLGQERMELDLEGGEGLWGERDLLGVGAWLGEKLKDRGRAGVDGCGD